MSGHSAEVTAPIEKIHVDQRGVGQLDKENLVARYRADGLGIDLARDGMEAVHDQPDIGMIGAPHDLPGIAMVVDMAPPGQGLIPDAQAASFRALAQLTKIGGCSVDAAERSRRYVGTHKHQIGAQLFHDVELALGPIKGALALGLR